MKWPGVTDGHHGDVDDRGNEWQGGKDEVGRHCAKWAQWVDRGRERRRGRWTGVSNAVGMNRNCRVREASRGGGRKRAEDALLPSATVFLFGAFFFCYTLSL